MVALIVLALAAPASAVPAAVDQARLHYDKGRKLVTLEAGCLNGNGYVAPLAPPPDPAKTLFPGTPKQP